MNGDHGGVNIGKRFPMRVFMTGATGFIGTALTQELIAAGHQVIGLARNESAAAKLEQAGATVHRGTLDLPQSLTEGAEKADAVIHTAFDHDFSRMMENCEKDRRAICALAAGLIQGRRPMIVTSVAGLGSGGSDQIATESFMNTHSPNPRLGAEILVDQLVSEGLPVSIVRLSQIHDRHRQGLISYWRDIARKHGTVAYIGKGDSCMAACPVADTARLYRLALEHAKPGMRYHAVSEPGVPTRSVAEALAEGLSLPVHSIAQEDATACFGWLAPFMSLDMRASSTITQHELGWHPQGSSLLEDLRQFEV